MFWPVEHRVATLSSSDHTHKPCVRVTTSDRAGFDIAHNTAVVEGTVAIVIAFGQACAVETFPDVESNVAAS